MEVKNDAAHRIQHFLTLPATALPQRFLRVQIDQDRVRNDEGKKG